MTWDSHLLIFLPVLLWFLAIHIFRGRLNLSVTSEGLLLIGGCIASIVISRMVGRSAHFFLGDGLILLQLVRLARPLNKREKLTSLVIACFHFGVMCTLAPNIRFVLLFVASIFIFPKALKEVLLTADDPSPNPLPPAAAAYPRPFRLPRRVYAGLLAISIVCFLGMPRFTGTPLQLRDTIPNQGSLFDSILDPRRSGQSNSRDVLMQMEGDYIGYLRCFALTRIVGDTWQPERSRVDPLVPREPAPGSVKTHHRKVFIKNPHYLGKVLPVDGQVAHIEGNFFSTPYRTQHDAIETHTVWSTGNNTYEYSIFEEAIPLELPDYLRESLVSYPPQSERLQQWVKERTAGATNALDKARMIESYLRLNFTYNLGSPELSRLSPVDDFIFNQQEGHCERFAAALALTLRMQGIPSRIAIGYLATERNLFSGRLQVRFSDAHAWTEAHIDGLGWVSFDATPGSASQGIASNLLSFMEALDFAWYSHVVNFNGLNQQDLFGHALGITTRIPEESWARAFWLLLAALAALVVYRCRERFAALRFRRDGSAEAAHARHSYGRMLAMLDRAGAPRPRHLTPLEFLEILRSRGIRGYNEAAVITHAFCRTAYAGQPLPPETLAQVEAALVALRSSLRKSPKLPSPK